MRRCLSFLPVLAALALGGCPPEDSPNGEEGRLYFTIDWLDASWFRLAADGASTRLMANRGEAYVFSSSDPSIAAITPDGAITTGEPGTVTISASTETGEIDRIAMTVSRATGIRIDDAQRNEPLDVLFVGFEHAVAFVRYDDEVGLHGRGGYVTTADGVLSARAMNDDERWLLRAADEGAIVSGSASGTGSITVSTGSVSTTRTFRIAAADEIERIESFSATRAGGGSDSVAIRMYTGAFIGAEQVAGATCQWNVVGATVGLDEPEPDGTLVTDFWTTGERFSATCTIGSVSETFDVVVADVPE